jgi:hypothetical protein
MTPYSDSKRTPWWLLGAAAMAFFATALYAWTLHGQLLLARETAYQATNDVQSARAELATTRHESSRLGQTLAILTAPDVVRIELTGRGVAAAATGRATWSRERGLVFIADKLPPPPAGRVYQLWALTPTPVNLGALAVSSDGSAIATATASAGLTKVTGVEVTIEATPTAATTPGPVVLASGVSVRRYPRGHRARRLRLQSASPAAEHRSS